MGQWWIAAAVVGVLPPCVGAAQAPARPATPAALAEARQLVLVTADGWDATEATLRRYERATPGTTWRPVGEAVPVTLGRTGMAWGAGEGGGPLEGMPAGARSGALVKREGDGRSPAGAFPLLAAFGYGAADTTVRSRLPFLPVADGTVCVDDAASPLYNAVVDRAAAGRARWTSAERMRRVAGYRQGVVVGYNGAWVRGASGTVRTPGARAPRAGRGSCIFLHVWDGPDEPTAGCTAMDEAALAEVVAWLDPRARPALVQLPAGIVGPLRGVWGLP